MIDSVQRESALTELIETLHAEGLGPQYLLLTPPEGIRSRGEFIATPQTVKLTRGDKEHRS